MHPIENNSEVQVSVNADAKVTANVVSSTLNEVDGAYHYDLRAEFSDGNNAATVQILDVHESLVIGKE